MSTQTTEQKLNVILSVIEDAALREELFHRFFLENPLEVAKFLHASEIPDAVKAQVLALKVGMPPQYQGTDLSPLIERAIQGMWARLAENQP